MEEQIENLIFDEVMSSDESSEGQDEGDEQVEEEEEDEQVEEEGDLIINEVVLVAQGK